VGIFRISFSPESNLTFPSNTHNLSPKEGPKQKFWLVELHWNQGEFIPCVQRSGDTAVVRL